MKNIFTCLCGIFFPVLVWCQVADTLKLKDFRPVSIYHVPIHHPQRAKFPVIDFHSHNYPESAGELNAWLKTMDEVGIEKSIILSYASGAGFDSVMNRYKAFGKRFEVWCGFDYTGCDKPGWAEKAVAELERCYKMGARGVGELGDKGLGELYSTPTPGYGMHINDPRMKPLLKKCAELKMPVSIHVAEDAWMYLPPDAENDGLLNAATWHVNMNKPGILNHDQLVQTLEQAAKENPATIFIACHLANCCSNLQQLSKLLDECPNLFADIAARYGEISPVPVYTRTFMEKYSDRLVYGTDMGTNPGMYRVTFRILETADEHFYERELFSYHWPLYGLALPDALLEKLYHGNGEKILARK